MQSLSERASVRCLELLETVFDGIERLSRRGSGSHPVPVPRMPVEPAGASENAMKVAVN